jgi:hypothetical protein
VDIDKTLYHGTMDSNLQVAQVRQKGIFLTEDRVIAAAYAGKEGVVAELYLSPEAKVLDASGNIENCNWHKPSSTEWHQFIEMGRRYDINQENTNYVQEDWPLFWEAVVDPMDGLGLNPRLSDVLVGMGYHALLTYDLSHGIIGDIYQRHGANASEDIGKHLKSEDVPIVIVFNSEMLCKQ